MSTDNISDQHFRELLVQLIPYVYATAYKIAGGPDNAEDLAQNTLLDAWEKRHQLSDRAKMKGWLRTICVNRLLMDKRRADYGILSLDALTSLAEEGSRFELTDTSPTAEDEVIADEAIRNLRNGCFTAMSRKLTLHQRTVFSLVDMFGVSIDETAEILGISVPAVKGLLHRARMHLYNFFDGRCEWVIQDAHCHCAAWINFTGRKAALRDRTGQRKIIDSFGEKPACEEHSSGIREKILQIYRSIPDAVPPQSWYEEITDLITEKYS